MKTVCNLTTKKSRCYFCVSRVQPRLSKTITLIFLSLSLLSIIAKAQTCGNAIDGFAAAAGVTGGAGGQNIVVTNLNSSGAGSLKDAIAQSGRRIITFTPGLTGTINFTNVVYVDFPDMTIDGKGADITVSGFSLSVHKGNSTPVQNVIIKNLTFGNTEPDRSAIRIEFGSSNVWVDHCTFYNNSVGNTGQGLSIWDRGLGFNGLTGITLSWNHFKTPNKKSILIGSETEYTGGRVSIHNNWFEGVDARNPRVHSGMLVHMWNNYLDNWVEYGVGVSDGADLLSQNDIFDKNGGTAVDPAYGNVNANSVNVNGSYRIGSPLPTTGTTGIFPLSSITYTANIQTANEILRQRIMQGAGANRCSAPTIDAVQFFRSGRWVPRPIVGDTSKPYQLAVFGSNFDEQSKVLVNGIEVLTTLVNNSELHAKLPAGRVSSVGNLRIQVRNSGGQTSNLLTF